MCYMMLNIVSLCGHHICYALLRDIYYIIVVQTICLHYNNVVHSIQVMKKFKNLVQLFIND